MPLSELATLPTTANPDIDGRGEERLLDTYRRWFEALPANTPERLEEAFGLRFQVYCVENPYEDPANNPDGRETDEFDSHSAHSLLVHRPSGLTAGTVRLVLPSDATESCFPIQRVCTDPRLKDPGFFPIAMTGEVSRFSISKGFRKRRGDARYPGMKGMESDQTSARDERRMVPHMTLGLIESLVRMSVENGVTRWCAVMEPALLRLLSRLGIYFDPIGPIVDYHGRRQPCHISLDAMLERVAEERPDIWEIITEEGAHWEALKSVQAVRN